MGLLIPIAAELRARHDESGGRFFKKPIHWLSSHLVSHPVCEEGGWLRCAWGREEGEWGRVRP